MLAPMAFPVPKKFESFQFAKRETGHEFGSVMPEKVIPNSIEVVDCSSTFITKSIRFSSEPCTIRGTIAEKKPRLYKLRKPVSIFFFEKMSPVSNGISRKMTLSFVFLFPATLMRSMWLLLFSVIYRTHEIRRFSPSFFMSG